MRLDQVGSLLFNVIFVLLVPWRSALCCADGLVGGCSWYARAAFNRLASWAYQPHSHDLMGVLFSVGGFLFSVGLLVLRVRFLRWPLHPGRLFALVSTQTELAPYSEGSATESHRRNTESNYEWGQDRHNVLEPFCSNSANSLCIGTRTIVIPEKRDAVARFIGPACKPDKSGNYSVIAAHSKSESLFWDHYRSRLKSGLQQVYLGKIAIGGLTLVRICQELYGDGKEEI